MCNDYEGHLESTAYCEAMAKLQLAMNADAIPAQSPPVDDTRVNDIAPTPSKPWRGSHRKSLARAFALRSYNGMAFVIMDTAGQPLRDAAGGLIVLAVREEAARWVTRGERVEPYIERRHRVRAIEKLLNR